MNPWAMIADPWGSWHPSLRNTVLKHKKIWKIHDCTRGYCTIWEVMSVYISRYQITWNSKLYNPANNVWDVLEMLHPHLPELHDSQHCLLNFSKSISVELKQCCWLKSRCWQPYLLVHQIIITKMCHNQSQDYEQVMNRPPTVLVHLK